MTNTQYPNILAGQEITADLLNSFMPKTAIKTTDQTKTSTTTVAADPELFVTLEAGATYIWHGWVIYKADPAVDLTIDWTAPAGSSGTWGGAGPGANTTSATANGYTTRAETNDVEQARGFYGPSDGAVSAILHGIITTGSAGNYSLLWGPSASSATATTVYHDSWISFQRVA